MQIYITKNNQQLGPFEESKVLEMLTRGQFSPNDLGIRRGETQWQPLHKLFPNFGQQFLSPQTPAWNPPISAPVTYQAPLKNQTNGGSKAPIFILIGVVGGLFLLGAIGVLGYFAIGKKSGENKVSTVTPNSPTTPAPSPSGTPNVYADESKMKELFEKDEDKYTKVPAKVQLTKEPYIKGKILYYVDDKDYGEKQTIWVNSNRTPATSTGTDEKLKDLFAQKPEEVGTIVLRRCQQYLKGMYEIYRKNSGYVEKRVPGYEQKCEVTLIDNSISAVIFRKQFIGKLENDTYASGKEEKFEAYVPYTEIAEFIAGLPRR